MIFQTLPRVGAIIGTAFSLGLASPVFAQDEIPQETIFDGDFLSIGIGAAYNASYTGSDDYVISVLPIVQGSYGGIDVNPRPAGLALDFVQDANSGPGIDLGIAMRLRSDRAVQIKDPVVESLGKLDRAFEVGPSAGISFTKLTNPYDSLSFNADVMWDVAGAHDGMVIAPSVTYFTPLSRSMAASLSLSTEYADSDFTDYYFAVSPLQSAATGGVLPAYTPSGGGFTKAGVTLLTAFDLDGDLTNGGFGLVVITGYSRVLGDAKRSPFTSVRGSADQFFGAVGVGYTF